MEAVFRHPDIGEEYLTPDACLHTRPGDVVVIPAGVPQQISNDGDSDLVFYCICTPRFRKAKYEALE
jgi:mannose-6-phosphate isomerase-like protein (cupin superfamily)